MNLLTVSLFALCAQLIDASLGNPARKQKFSTEKCLLEINKFRNVMAKKGNLANMHEIEYDTSLERTFPTCQEAISAYIKDNRIHFFESDTCTGGPNDDKTISNFANEILTDKSNKYLRRVLHPSHMTMGCTLFKEPCMLPYDDSNSPKAIGSCVYGGSENVEPMTGLAKGEAASKCSGGKSNMWENLCKPTSTSSVQSTMFHFAFLLSFVIFMFF
ncbi:hypothetical protein GCK72_012146 [Caenorhabditis remanei]|uniref:Uncharacterized protein n=1 Tax=Caenorhabditis remanei TaxID=31234 RepID=A0A6A5GM33_CAERE|nr:hypothetical protein GCK72_012146 [Caenorhabditis remanei]KAF1755696.1 hypothetical protein GCK72_012146 [Caenorhabditis remanei]